MSWSVPRIPMNVSYMTVVVGVSFPTCGSGPMAEETVLRPLRVTVPGSAAVRFWTVMDVATAEEHLLFHEFLRHKRLTEGRAEGTTRRYAEALCRFGNWTRTSGRTWEEAAAELNLYATLLDDADMAAGVRAGPSAVGESRRRVADGGALVLRVGVLARTGQGKCVAPSVRRRRQPQRHG